MGLGDVIQVEEFGSPTKINAKVYHWTDALTLSNMAYTPCMRVVPTTTGYGFTKDIAMCRSADNDKWIIDGLAKHVHSQNTDQDGGEFVEVLFANQATIIDLNIINPLAAVHHTIVNGTGAEVVNNISTTGDSVSWLDLKTGTSNNGWAKILTIGVTPSFGARSKYQIGMEITADTNMIFRCGIGSESIELANNSLKKYGMEGCSAAPEGKVILVFSADSITRSTQASVEDIVESGGASYVLQHSPSLNIKFIKGSLESVVTKSSNIPSSGSIVGLNGDPSGVIKNGIKSNIVSEDKHLHIFGHRFVAKESSSRWDNVAWQD